MRAGTDARDFSMHINTTNGTTTKLYLSLSLLLSLFVSFSACANKAPLPIPLHITIVNPETMIANDPALYYEQLLVLALEKTRTTDGDFVIDHKPNPEGVGRIRAMLTSNTGVDVIWSSVTQERKETMLVIPFNLLRGLNDYRVLLIHKDEQQKFNNIKNLNGLRELTAGGGVHWNDTRVLRANEIQVVTSIIYPSLFKMLAAHRFDFITCGLHEIDFVYDNFGKLGLAIESNLLLHYEQATDYSFFVNKEKPALANRIQRGLALAEADGSFERTFNNFPGFQQHFSEIKNNHRLKIELKDDVAAQSITP